MRCWVFAMGLVLVAGLASPGAAEPLRHPLAGNEAYFPPASVAREDGILGLYFNPAALAMRPGEWSILGLTGMRIATDDPALESEFEHPFTEDWSLAAGGALALGIDRFRGTGGLHHRFVTPDSIVVTPIPRRVWRFNVGYGHRFPIRPWRSELALGAAYRRTRSEAYALDGLSTWDLGALFRWRQWASLGLSVRNLDRPALKPVGAGAAEEISPSTVAALAIRPGLHWATLSADLHNVKEEAGWKQRLHLGLDLHWRGRFRLRLDWDDQDRIGVALFASHTHWRLSGQMSNQYSSQTGTRYGGVGLEWRNRRFGQPVLPGRRFLRLELGRTEAHDGNTAAAAGAGNTLRLLDRIRRARDERDLAGLLLVIGEPCLGLAQLEELHLALLDYREATGRPVVCYADRYSLGAYYIASAADRVLLNPHGELLLEGLSLDRRFYAAYWKRLGAEPDFHQTGEQHAALAGFTAEGLDPADLAVDRELLEQQLKILVRDISASRGLENFELRRSLEHGRYEPEEARGAGLVDELFHPGQLSSYLERLSGTGRILQSEDLDRRRYGALTWGEAEAIAVVRLDGTLVRGESGLGTLGPETGVETVARALRQAREDPIIKGVILRVNSSGGGALASDRIRREVLMTRLVKPLVVSCSDRTLSGAYSVSLEGDLLFVMETSLTAGVAVLGGKLFWPELQEGIGPAWSGAVSDSRVRRDSSRHLLTDSDRRELAEAMASRYREFVADIARRRGISGVEAERAAWGRCYSGGDALDFDLVDGIGGLDRARESLEEMADLPPGTPLRFFTGTAPVHSGRVSMHVGHAREQIPLTTSDLPLPAPGWQPCQGERLLLFDPSLAATPCPGQAPSGVAP